jgi:hypothetical protein
MRAHRRSTRTRTLLALYFISCGENARNAVNAAVRLNPVRDSFKFLAKEHAGDKRAQETLAYSAPEELALARYMAAALRRLVYVLVAEYGNKRQRMMARARLSDLQYKGRNLEAISAANTARHRKERFLKKRHKQRACLRCGAKFVAELPGFCPTCRKYAARAIND